MHAVQHTVHLWHSPGLMGTMTRNLISNYCLMHQHSCWAFSQGQACWAISLGTCASLA